MIVDVFFFVINKQSIFVHVLQPFKLSIKQSNYIYTIRFINVDTYYFSEFSKNKVMSQGYVRLGSPY